MAGNIDLGSWKLPTTTMTIWA